MGFTIIFTARGVRETERPVSFIPKGALTHHPQAGGGTACGSRALSEGDFAFCGKRQTTPQHFPGTAALSAQVIGMVRIVPHLRLPTGNLPLAVFP